MGLHAYRERSNAVQHSSRQEHQSQNKSLCGNWTGSVVTVQQFRTAQGKLSNTQNSRRGGSIKRRLIGSCDRLSYPTRTCRNMGERNPLPVRQPGENTVELLNARRPAYILSDTQPQRVRNTSEQPRAVLP